MPAVLLLAGDRHGAAAAAALGAIVAVLPVTILADAMVYENVPIPTALVHMADWGLELVRQWGRARTVRLIAAPLTTVRAAAPSPGDRRRDTV
ncbi:hypothetical protein [Nocardia cyriacigeorgica]|uniref:hypothetical protein n=1 Tax=Nocardia cyriacigeorgica TaxID=135487 RepID=UPI001E32BB7C|nr:hypothetical protein [Nocardia cyriacigeorgica]